LLKTTPEDVPLRLRKVLADQKTIERELAQLKQQSSQSRGDALLGSAKTVNGVKVIAGRVDELTPEQLRTLADRLRDQIGSGIVCVGSAANGRVSLIVTVTKDLVPRFHAGRLIGPVAKAVGGSGGGRPEFAQAGGRDVEQLDQALALIDDLVGHPSNEPV